jgi:hypothetical protein
MSENASTTPATTPADDAEATTEAATTKTPEWYESELSKVRDEAARQRVAKREAAEAAKAETSTEYEAKLAAAGTAHEATKVQLTRAQTELAKLHTALDANVPADKVKAFASALQGSTPEELKAHAAELNKLFGTVPAVTNDEPVDHSQGLGNGKGKGDDFDSYLTNLLK